MGREALLLAISVNNAAEAYLMHRQGDFDKAYAMVQRALEADEELERVYHDEVLIGDRLQLVHNTMRVAARQQDFGRASELLGSAIAFMEGYGTSIPLHHSWVPSRLKSDSDWDQLERQLIGELATILPLAVPSAWSSYCESIQLNKFLDGPRLDGLSRDWVALKAQFESGEWKSFLEGLPELLHRAFAEDSVLFYPMLWDYQSVLEQTPTDLARALQTQLLRDSHKWCPPKSLRPLLEKARSKILTVECA